MTQALLQMMAAGSPVVPIYVDDVFSATTYTGNGSTQTITNGINLSTNGGMVWIKGRSNTGNNAIHDTVRGATNYLYADATVAAATYADSVTAFNSNGFSLGVDGVGYWNTSPRTYASWTFRKAARFFDVVTYTGDGVNRTVSHSLGQVPGMIMVKRTNSTGSWMVYHRSLTSNVYNLVLNTTAAETSNATAWNSTTATSSVFSLGTHADVNTNGATYVAYLFAHDTGADGLIQCGSFTVTGSTADVTLGWEPQYVMMKRTDATGEWYIFDTARGWTVPGSNGDNYLWAQSSAAEATSASALGGPTATGFKFENLTSTGTYIYLAIRRPNKPPTVGTQVYNAIARTGTGAAATVTGVGFAPDSVWANNRTGGYGNTTFDRLRGATKALPLAATGAETTASDALTVFGVDGFTLGADTSTALINQSAASIITWCFRRAPSVFDVVRYTGNGGTNAQNHSLGVVPELIFLRNLISANWRVAHSFGASSCVDNMTFSGTNSGSLVAYPSVFSAQPTSTVFSLYGTATESNANTNAYTAYLFATKSGVSKVGTYTGTGVTNAINCGFTTGARFVMIKRTDSTGDWYVWDTTRGIIAGNDPYLLLNSAAAEVTSTDYIDPSTAGFELSSTAPAAINANGGTFIYLALA